MNRCGEDEVQNGKGRKGVIYGWRRLKRCFLSLVQEVGIDSVDIYS